MTQQPLALQLADSADACQLTVHDCSLVAKELRRLHGLAQRQWVGLTDEQIESLWDHGMYVHCSGITALRAITRAIEAKLKEKNT